MYAYVYICMHVCMYVCICAYVHVGMYMQVCCGLLVCLFGDERQFIKALWFSYRFRVKGLMRLLRALWASQGTR